MGHERLIRREFVALGADTVTYLSEVGEQFYRGLFRENGVLDMNAPLPQSRAEFNRLMWLVLDRLMADIVSDFRERPMLAEERAAGLWHSKIARLVLPKRAHYLNTRRRAGS